MNILCVDDDEIIREYVSFLLDSIDQSNILEANSCEGAIEILKSNPPFDVIVSDFNMNNKNGLDLYSFVSTLNYTPLFILMSATANKEELKNIYSTQEYHDNFFFISKPFTSEQFFKFIKNLDHPLQLDKIEQKYKRVSLNTLSNYTAEDISLYVKINEKKYVKILGKEEIVNTAFLSKYRKKDVEYLYMNVDDFNKVVSKLPAHVLIVLDDPCFDEEQKIEATKTGLEIIHKKLKVLGITEENKQVANEIVKHYINKKVTPRDLLKVVKKILEGKNYLSKHSLMCLYIAPLLTQQVSWWSKEVVEKILLTGILHDAFVENSEIARKDALNILKETEYKKAEINRFKAHPHKISSLLKNDQKLPSDIDVITLQHHEKPDGSGFPHGIDGRGVKKLSCLFIIIEDICNEFLENDITPQLIEKIIAQFRIKYNSHQFKKINEDILDYLRNKFLE